MKKNSYKVDFEIYIVFIIVIGISVFNAIYSSTNISKNQEATSKIMMIDVPTLQNLENMNLLLTKSKMYCTNWVYLESNKEDKEMLKTLQTIEYPVLKGNIKVLMKSWKSEADIDTMNKIFSEFEQLMIYQKDLMRTLVRFEDYQNPVKIFVGEGIIEHRILPYSTKIIGQLSRLIISKQTAADELHTNMLRSSQKLMWSVLGLAILIVFVVLIAAFYMSNHIILPTMRLKNHIVQMAKGEIPTVSVNNRKNAVGQMTQAVGRLAESMKLTTRFALEIGKGNLLTDYDLLSEKDELGNALIQMRNSLRSADEENRQRNWVSSRTEKINEVLRENTADIGALSNAIIGTMVKYLNAYHGGLYLVEESMNGNESNIILHGSYSLEQGLKVKPHLKMGEGLVGQAIQDGEVIYLKNAPAQYARINSHIGELAESHVLIIPLKHHDKVYGAVEIAGFNVFELFEIGFIKSIGETIGSSINSVIANTVTKRLLEETQLQAERMRAQEEELIRTNEELSNQSSLLLNSQEELKKGNIEMKKKARELENKNEILEQAREALMIKAKELELNNRYKSEFLANMSHELRTPLNSVLILAKLLWENKDNNLTIKQTEYAKVIHKSGNDLLHLISDILDLSKLEAGKIELLPERTDISVVKEDIHSLFREVANEKQIDFIVESHADVPKFIVTDSVRLEQIIKNLLSNAFKFTPINGKVTFKIKRPGKNILFSNQSLADRNEIIEFSVSDSGIGIPSEKQALIFEAFQQADGSTNRKYGGTGLGLSISKMLVSMLGGEMQLVSEQGIGSTFYCYLPVSFNDSHEILNVSHETTLNVVSVLDKGVNLYTDDRNNISPTDKYLLIAESDLTFGKILVDLAHEKHFKAILTNNETDAISFSEKILPAAIIIDDKILVKNLYVVVDKLKEKNNSKSIPIHILSDFNRVPTVSEIGATACLRKPLDKKDLDDAFQLIDKSMAQKIQRVLVVEDMTLHQEIIKNLLASHYSKIVVEIAGNAEDAKVKIKENNFDCIVLDLDLGNGSEEGCALLKQIKTTDTTKQIPVIIFTGTDMEELTGDLLLELSEAIVPKGSGALDLLIKETSLFLNMIEEPVEKTGAIMPKYMNAMLEGKTVLLADDDMRNIYALTSVLESNKMIVIPASTGRDALLKLNKFQNVDLILMDIMMPEMDGYEAIQNIREIERHKTLPIIALTAKAMTGDKEKCIQVGASDYISKPINIEELFSKMRIWLYKEG